MKNILHKDLYTVIPCWALKTAKQYNNMYACAYIHMHVQYLQLEKS